MKTIAKRMLKWFQTRLLRDLHADNEIERLLLGRMACAQFRKILHIHSLADVEFKVSSQWGEDGIIDWLIERLGIKHNTFVEFGVQDYKESNTRFLLQNRNWSGIILDADSAYIDAIRRDDISWRYDLHTVEAFITTSNINNLIASHGLQGTIGLLSVDIDGNDYWILKAIEIVSPIILIVEYNALWGDQKPVAIPYHEKFVRSEAHYSHVYYGASIAAFCQIAAQKGYRLVGTNSIGSNAFFVRADYAVKLDGLIEDMQPRPARCREARHENGHLAFNTPAERLQAVGHLPLVNVETGATARVTDWAPLYSPEWAAGMGLSVTEKGLEISH